MSTEIKKNARKFEGESEVDSTTVATLSSSALEQKNKRVKESISTDDDEVEGVTEASSSTPSVSANDERLQRMSDALRTILECMGEDVDREGLQSTPMRAAKALCFFTKGYQQTVEEVVGEGIFHEDTGISSDNQDMVLVRDIEIHSLCEHHMVPFSGKIHIAYIPNGSILGLSKLARIADVYARRLQVQERLTKQIAEAIQRLVSPKGVAVMMEASHMCMVMRGVEKSGASTTTSSYLGAFKEDRALRSEFLAAVNK